MRDKWTELAREAGDEFALPKRFGEVTILALGEVTPQTAATRHMIYPVGFRSRHVIDGSMELTCSIEAGEGAEPVFVVTGEGVSTRGSTPTEAWRRAEEKLGVEGGRSGLEAFGLAIPAVAIALSKLPGVGGVRRVRGAGGGGGGGERDGGPGCGVAVAVASCVCGVSHARERGMW